VVGVAEAVVVGCDRGVLGDGAGWPVGEVVAAAVGVGAVVGVVFAGVGEAAVAVEVVFATVGVGVAVVAPPPGTHPFGSTGSAAAFDAPPGNPATTASASGTASAATMPAFVLVAVVETMAAHRPSIKIRAEA